MFLRQYPRCSLSFVVVTIIFSQSKKAVLFAGLIIITHVLLSVNGVTVPYSFSCSTGFPKCKLSRRRIVRFEAINIPSFLGPVCDDSRFLFIFQVESSIGIFDGVNYDQRQ